MITAPKYVIMQRFYYTPVLQERQFFIIPFTERCSVPVFILCILSIIITEGPFLSSTESLHGIGIYIV